MDQQPNVLVSLESSPKPSKLMALIALVIAFALPFILVKSFSHKHKAVVASFSSSPFESQPSSIPSISVEKTHSSTKNLSESSITRVLEERANLKPSALSMTKAKAPPIKITKDARHKNIQNSTATKSENEVWVTIKIRKGDSLTTVFKRLGLSPQTLQNILRGNPHARVLSHFKPNQEIQFLIKKNTLKQMIVPFSNTQDLMIYHEGQRYISKINGRKMTTQNKLVTAVIRGSLYSSAKRNNIPYKLMQQMTEIFTWDINFAKDIRSGDRVTIIYKGYYIDNKLMETGEILAVSYQTRGRTYQAIRHTDRSGHTDYYSPQGTSLKKAFDRYPLRFSHISSTFSLSRYHPILHYRRAHKGVDLAAPIGTPIRATGDGRIEIIGRQSGYGNMIKINHNKTYSTIYGHMLKFQKGLSRGDFVRRGQIIGYVGQTGLASGPHCHYEFHFNHQPKNPTTADLPRGFPIDSKEMASFKANSAILLAQLKASEQTRLARQ
jgi:murein DD-endopeptidase MepM/ murein hydrolase activator NlpD